MKNKTLKKKKMYLLKENRWIASLLSIVSLVAICLIFGILTGGRFLTVKNLELVINQALIVGVVATGASYIFATGNVNIAMGSSAALVATLGALVYMKTESVFVMFLVAITVGIIIMVTCALLSTIFRVPVIFITIVMMVLLRSIQSEILGGSIFSVPYAMTNALKEAYVPYIISIIFFVLCIVIFHFTEVGRSLKMVGSNEVCAYLTGVFRDKYLVISFLIAGIGVGIGAIMTIIRTGAISVTTGASMNMDVMLAIVLGGMPITGGSKSKAYAAVIGAITVTVLNNGLLMIGVDSTVLQGVRGVIFLILVLASSKRSILLPAREG